jgi:SAM-dependent methyltransferase
MSSIYDHPDTYDLEHSGPQPDVEFFIGLVRAHRPARILEYACGNGRLTVPVAEAAVEWQGAVTGIDTSTEMLEAARQNKGADLVTWREEDVTVWRPEGKFDFIFSGCGSMSHLTTTDQQIAVWQNAYQSLDIGGRFAVAELSPDHAALAESMRSPAHGAVTFDGDFGDGKHRLIRCRAVRYRADLQRMKVRYFYDRFPQDARGGADRFVDDYEAHVYFPNELRLLFRLSGFKIETEWGGYDGASPGHTTRSMIICGVRGG